MNIGGIHRKITIESYTVTKSTFGVDEKTWSTFAEAFAQVQSVSGSERVEGDRNTATNRIRFKIRFIAGINEDMRIIYNSNYYDIHEIQELAREGLWITCSRKYSNS